MAALIVILAGAVVWLEVDAMKRFGRAALRDAQHAYEPQPSDRIEDVVAGTAQQLSVLLDLRACWFEPFPFDALLPRIEKGRIVLPTPEPGVAPCCNFGVELPVRVNDLTLGRFVLQPNEPTVGVSFAPTLRDRAIALADRVGPPLAAALISPLEPDPHFPRRTSTPREPTGNRREAR